MNHLCHTTAIIRKLRKLAESFMPLGPTQQFPSGKLVPADEGEIRFAIGHANGKVILDFGKPTAWIGMPPEQALALADALTKHAKACQ